ncbi:unnamed protein product [Moneuplotes crassus]|uniref:Uncharacterized protein n=1 Tax=Euplotes crassus TaxID=5936 RepID=A0AAD1XBR5_EUPCR|nr:unnamed protein product [Moneuplotes crassus]
MNLRENEDIKLFRKPENSGIMHKANRLMRNSSAFGQRLSPSSPLASSLILYSPGNFKAMRAKIQDYSPVCSYVRSQKRNFNSSSFKISANKNRPGSLIEQEHQFEKKYKCKQSLKASTKYRPKKPSKIFVPKISTDFS